MKLVTITVLAVSILLSATGSAEVKSPLPSPRQLKWHELEFYGFIHFTINTFTDREWGNGDEPSTLFNPTDFDPDQIVRVAKDAGMKGLILTCKHHDGFCLWPSQTTEHSVKNSPWKNGKGDVVKEISDACRKHGLKFGVYLSPWDRNHKDYGRPEYLTVYRNQLRELLTNYGPIFEVWFDGANGGSGYYGGARETRSIDNRTYYDWPNTFKIIRELQPDAVIFSDAGPDVRWVGNEHGTAGDPCWTTLNQDDFWPGHADKKRLNSGDRPGTHWCPAEVDVSIRPGWFYHAHEDSRVRSPENLVKLYFESVGRGASFLLNLPPDRRGRIHENDVKSLQGFRKLMDEIFATDLAQSATKDGTTLTFQQPVTFNVIRLREDIRHGQHIEDFVVEAWQSGQWRPVYNATAIGSCRLAYLKSVTTDKIRVRVLSSSDTPIISEIALFNAPDLSKSVTAAVPSAPVLSKKNWKLVSASYQAPDGEATRAFDSNPGTLWHTHGPDGEHPGPQEVIIDLGKTETFTGFTYLPRQDNTTCGIVDQYAFYVSADGKDWGQPVSDGEFGNVKANPIEQIVPFAKPRTARFIKFVAKHSADGNHITVAEIGLLAK
jgi:alpha-L-fucosidase